MHRQAKQSKFTLIGLLHFLRNYISYFPPPFYSLPPVGGKVTIRYIYQYFFLALDGLPAEASA
jgi:hypothetical protein